ncbi:MAG: ABC transporter permease [Micropepsaceae bacterium]
MPTSRQGTTQIPYGKSRSFVTVFAFAQSVNLESRGPIDNVAPMFFNTVFMAFRELRANLLRTSLTCLGMIIGVAAVITVVAVMQGVSAQVMGDLSSMARNLIVIVPKREPGQDRRIQFKISDADAIRQEIAGAQIVAPIAENARMFSANGHEHETEVDGSTNALFEIRNWQMALGRRFTNTEINNASTVCVLGQMVRKELFGLQNPVGAIIRSGTFSCRVVGVMAVSAHSFITSDVDDVVIMPILTYQRRLSGNSDVNLINVMTPTTGQISGAISDITRLLRERRGITPERKDNFRVVDIRDEVKTLDSVGYKLSLAVGGVAAISLVVGGIGIMNVMLVAVTERTREIGIRMAVGAEQNDVLLQFLVEAVVLSLAGGIAGALLGFGGAAAIGSALNVPVYISAEILALGLGVPVMIGVLFGFFPALRASRLDPIDALRFE